MTQEIIYPYGTADVTVPIGQYILIAALEGKANIYVGTDLANYPSSFEFDATIENEQVTYGTYSVSTQIRINAKAGKVYYDVGASPSISIPAPSAVAASSDPYSVDGLAAAQGGAVEITGGTSSTSANAGGDVDITGGTAGATGAGGAVVITGGAGGATSGLGGAVTITSGTATADDASGTIIISSGLGAESAAAVIAGASGDVNVGTDLGGSNIGGATGEAAGASGDLSLSTGNGGDTNSTGAHDAGAAGDVIISAGDGGDASAGTGDGGAGGNIFLTSGSGGSTTGGSAGADGDIIMRGVIVKSQGAPTAKTDAATLTAAELLGGIITIDTQTTGNKALTLPTGTDMSAGAPNMAVGDSFDFSVINISTTAGDTGTVTANTDHTLVGNGVVADINPVTDATSGLFRCRKTAATTWICYRIA